MKLIPVPVLALQFGSSAKVIGVSSIADASRQWCQFRDRMGWGASESPSVRVVDTATGTYVARISYNGRAWDIINGKEIAL